MNLWIRSQYKEKLIKCNDIAIATDSEDGKTIGYKIVGYFDKNTEYEELGFYTSKERALEVLDEIQNILKPTIITTGYECELKENIKDKTSFNLNMIPTKTEIQELSTYVYQMPLE